MEKFIPSVVGAWLAGTYDRDKPVARAASDGISSFLDTDEKVTFFWRKCQTQVLQFAQEAIEETAETLSDSRTVNKDDSQEKFNRVIGASLSLIINLFTKLSREDISQHQEEYENLLVGNKTLWGFVASKDPFLRKTTSQLLKICLDKDPSIIEKDLKTIGNAFVNEGLRSRGAGSALSYLEAMSKLTAHFPSVWLAVYKNKSNATPLSRLTNFVQQGSLSSPADYWILLSGLVTRLPRGVLPESYSGSVDFLKAVNDGIASRDEARSNIGTAWICYINIVKHLLFRFTSPEEKTKLLLNTVIPLFDAYAKPSPEASRWTMGSNTAALAKAFHLCVAVDRQNMGSGFSVEAEWKRLTGAVVESIKTSLPEQSKDYQKNQMALVSEAHRTFSLFTEITKYNGADKQDFALYDFILIESTTDIITAAMEVITARNGKPFGAAGTLEAGMRSAPELVQASPPLVDAITKFLGEQLPRLIVSPSSSYLISSLKLLASFPNKLAITLLIWESTCKELESLSDSNAKASAGEALMTSRVAAKVGRANDSVQKLILEAHWKAMETSSHQWRRLAETAVLFNMHTDKTIETMFEKVLETLDNPELFDNAFNSLEYLTGHRPEVLETDDALRITVMTKLLSMSESKEPGVVTRAGVLRRALADIESSGATSAMKKSPLVTIIQDNLETASPTSLSIRTLVSQAQTLVTSIGLDNVEDLFPNYDEWKSRFCAIGPPNLDHSLSLTNNLNGAVVLIPTLTAVEQQIPTASIRRDLEGFSIPFRMALYTCQLFAFPEVVQKLSLATQIRMRGIMAFSCVLATDQIDLRQEGWVWESLDDPEVETQIHDFIRQVKLRIQVLEKGAKNWRDPNSTGQSLVANRTYTYYMEKSFGLTATSFYAGRCLKQFFQHLSDYHGLEKKGREEWLESLNCLQVNTPNPMTALAVLCGFKEHLADSKLVANLTNRLVSDLTGMAVTDTKTLPALLMLNSCFAIYEEGAIPVQSNRMVFVVKHMTSWMHKPQDMSPEVAAQTCRALQLIFPCIRDVYGPYWEAAVNFCVSMWTSKAIAMNPTMWLHPIQTSLKLVRALKKYAEPNEDLVEALENSAEKISAGLLNLLAFERLDKETLPWKIVNELLSSMVSKIPQKHIHDLEEIYSLVASHSPQVQTAAFTILHRALPAAQEELSINVLLEKKDAQLPEELLSLLLEPPKLVDYSDEALSQFPPAIRSYLLAWHLVYDSFSTASHKVRSDYATQLKTENLISPLLDFLFDVLGHSENDPLNLDRAGITSDKIREYNVEIAQAEIEEKDMNWLLVHIYYMCLEYTPGLVKNWFVDCKSKQTRLAVESWTEKHFSSLVINDTLDDVQKWASEQEEPAEDEKELLVKVSKKSREVLAGYEVDEMMMQIAIRFPASYPLEGIKVEGVNRVAVGEKKWQSWLMITQGVITFSVRPPISSYPSPFHQLTHLRTAP